MNFVQSKTVVIADLNKLDVILSIKAAILYYKELYGEPGRVWVNPKDVADEELVIENINIERRGGCMRGKVMVL